MSQASLRVGSAPKRRVRERYAVNDRGIACWFERDDDGNLIACVKGPAIKRPGEPDTFFAMRVLAEHHRIRFIGEMVGGKAHMVPYDESQLSYCLECVTGSYVELAAIGLEAFTAKHYAF